MVHDKLNKPMTNLMAVNGSSRSAYYFMLIPEMCGFIMRYGNEHEVDKLLKVVLYKYFTVVIDIIFVCILSISLTF